MAVETVPNLISAMFNQVTEKDFRDAFSTAMGAGSEHQTWK